MTDQKTEQKPADHKAIREAARVGGDYTMVEAPDLRALLADLDEARAALTAAKAGGWLPIETAPKDGTAVLVSEGRFCSCVEWNEEFDWWAVDDNKLGPFRLRGAAPTHWQPLPNPPKEQSAGGPGSVDAVANPLSPT